MGYDYGVSALNNVSGDGAIPPRGADLRINGAKQTRLSVMRIGKIWKMFLAIVNLGMVDIHELMM